MSTLSERIRKARERYERESAAINEKYTELIFQKRAEIEELKRTDFYLGYMESYSASLESLESIYREIEDIQDRTLGIEFRVRKYIHTLKPRACTEGALKYFSRLVSECREAITLVSDSSSIENDVEPLKRFCQGLVDLRHLNDNSLEYLKADGTPEREKKEAIGAAEAELSVLRAEYNEAKKFEKMDCFADCLSLKNDINSDAARLDSIRLGAEPAGESDAKNGYKFLIGFSKTKLSESDRVFAESTLGADPRGLSMAPVYFNYRPGHSTLIIRASEKKLFDRSCLTLMRNLYFSVIGSVYSGGVQYFSAECNPKGTTIVGKIASKIKSTIGQKHVLASTDNLQDMIRGFDSLHETWREHSDAYLDFADIFEYNFKNPKARHKLVFSNIYGYPDGFNADNSGKAIEGLIQMAKEWGDEGFVTVIGERSDGSFNDRAPRLDETELGADVLEIDDKGNSTFNGQPINTNIESVGFDANRYWDSLKDYSEKKVSTSLSDTMLQLEKDRESGFRNKVPFYDKFIIPMGANEDSSGFDVEISFSTNQCFGIILGGTRSGKSSFMHSFILSACSQYSPDEVQFYLADFKEGGKEAPEFSNYQKIDGLRNLAMPHVRYLLLKSSPENSVDLLNKIISLMKERTVFYRTKGNRPYSSCCEYNKSEEVRSGKAPKLPFVFFLIDEANNMLTGGLSGIGQSNDARGDSRMLGDIKTKLENILKQAASAGIGIIFAGQDTKGLGDSHLAQIGTRICLKVDDEQIFRNIFNIQYGDTPKMIMRLEKGKAYYTNNGMREAPKFVRTAYAGATSGEQALNIAEVVRNKYSSDERYAKMLELQVLAGNENFVSVSHARMMERENVGVNDDLNEKKKKFATYHKILMGISGACGFPSYLEYDTNVSSRGYYAVAPEERLISIERCAMLSFLETYKKSDGTAPQLSYYALPNIMEAGMNELIAHEPKLAKLIDIIKVQSDLASKIMELGNLFDERQRLFTGGEKSSFDPVFLVIHDPEFIYDKRNKSWLPDFSSAKEEPVLEADTASTDDIDDILDEVDEEGEEEIMSLFSSFNIPAEPQAKTAKAKDKMAFTASEVRETLSMLFNHGNRYSIYLLVLATTEQTINMIKSGLTSSRDYCIYPSLADMRGKKDAVSGEGCAYIIPSGIKTRLLEYGPDDISRIVKSYNL